MTEHHWPLRDEDLATFQALDEPTRDLIASLLDEDPAVREAAQAALDRHPQRETLTDWLRQLPAYRDGYDDGDDLRSSPRDRHAWLAG